MEKSTRIPFVLLLTLVITENSFAPPEPDSKWKMNAVIVNEKVVSDIDLGAAQGATRRGNRLYIYGDIEESNPRKGVIKEYDLDLNPTGRKIFLTDRETVVSSHPTGLTFHPKFQGAFLGDTVKGVGKICQIDWEKALQQGNLNGAVKKVIVDDAAINGTRPEFVEWQGKTYLATSDYGDKTPQLRLYDAEKILDSGKTSSGVVRRIPFTPFNQTLYWDAEKKQLWTNRNTVLGRGWTVEGFELQELLKSADVTAPGSRVFQHTFPPHDELEGAIRVNDKVLFITSSRVENLVLGEIETVPERTTLIGTMGVNFTTPKSRQNAQMELCEEDLRLLSPYVK